MSLIKSTEDIAAIREGGRRLARVMDALEKKVAPGITTRELDQLAEKLIRDKGDLPAFLNYQPVGASYPYPATLCVSVNDAVVHGIPGDYALQEGDVVSLDLGLVHEGRVVDMARSVPVGEVSGDATKLIAVTKKALAAGIKAASPHGRVGDISEAVERASVDTAHTYGIIRDLGGHGVGHAVHEPPFVPNYGKAGTGPILKPGMVLAIEPMLTLGGDDLILDADGYTYRTKDGSLSAHFEHTIVITEKGAEVVTLS